MVNLTLHAKALRDVRDLHQRRDASRHGHVTAQYIRGIAQYPLCHAVKPARRVLGGHDGNIQLAFQLHVVVDVLLHQGVLVPEVVQLLDGAPYAQCLLVSIGPHGVQHQDHVIAHRLAYALRDFDVHGRVPVRVNLVRPPAKGLEVQCLLCVLLHGWVVSRAGVGGNFVPACAKQSVNRQPGDLARDVPQRHVHCADGVGGDGPVLLPHQTPYVPDVQRVSAYNHRFDELHQRPGEGVRPLSGRAEE